MQTKYTNITKTIIKDEKLKKRLYKNKTKDAKQKPQKSIEMQLKILRIEIRYKKIGRQMDGWMDLYKDEKLVSYFKPLGLLKR